MLLDKETQPIRDQLVGRISGVLVDHRGAWAVMAHPGHEISQATSCRRSESISGMPKIVKVQIGNTNRRDVLLPISHWVEITASHGTAALHGEHKVIRVGADVLG
jgi:hypothetical protein